MTHAEVLRLLRDQFMTTEDEVNPLMLGGLSSANQWYIERQEIMPSGPCTWQYLWWRTDGSGEDSKLTHCALMVGHPESALYCSPRSGLVPFEIALAEGAESPEFQEWDGFVPYPTEWTGDEPPVPHYLDLKGDLPRAIQTLRAMSQCLRCDVEGSHCSVRIEVRPSLPGLSHYELLFAQRLPFIASESGDDRFEIIDTRPEAVLMAMQFILNMMPLEILTDWLQDHNPDFAERMDRMQRLAAEDAAEEVEDDAA